MTNRHIAFTNKKRIEINKIMMDQTIRNKKVKALELPALDYDPNSQDVRLCTGMPVIARKNCKLLHIYNNETFTIKEIQRTKDTFMFAWRNRTMNFYYEQQINRELNGIHICGCRCNERLKAKTDGSM